MIDIKNLTKRFGTKVAVDNLSFSVEKGQVLGFLGPNGAGKSTTMRMITGYFPPTSGSIIIDGIDAWEKPLKAKSKIGYLPENAPLYSDMTVTAFLRFAAELRGMSGADRDNAVKRAIDLCSLDRVRNQSIDTLSKGYQHRTCFAQSILHNPDVLILDEPTDGLDPNQKHEVRSLIRRMGEEKAIIFSTHILEEVEAACSRAMIIDQGKVVADGTPDELKARAAEAGAVVVRVQGAPASTVVPALEQLSGVDRVLELDATGGAVTVRLLPKKKSTLSTEAIFNLCRDKSWVIQEMRSEEGNLDDFFREITVSDTASVKSDSKLDSAA